ncbi:MAG: VIT domain-containing protein [Phycisphaerales bacterium]
MKRWDVVLLVVLAAGLMSAAVGMVLPACSSKSSLSSERGAAAPAPAAGFAPDGDTSAVPLLGDIPALGRMFPESKPAGERGVVREQLADASALPARSEELWIIQRPGEGSRGRPRATTDDVPGCGALVTTLPDAANTNGAETIVPVPLKHTDVRGSIDGYLSSVTVTQQFHNPFSGKIEAVYVFPLPENAAVNDFLMTVGDRTIRGIIREREAAEKIYNEARSQGYTASLLTEERPNIFTQKVANIEPGKSIDITITYYSTLAYVDGAYEFVFPMVVGPRFNPPQSSPGGTPGTDNDDPDLRAGVVNGSGGGGLPGGSPPADGVGAVARGAYGSSGQRTEVQYLRPGERSGHDITLGLSIEAGGAMIGDVVCKSHVIETRRDGSSVEVRLSRFDSIPNKDFVLRYSLAGEGVRSAFLAATGEKGTHFSLMLVPPDALTGLSRQPLEMVFVLDCSGSMSGEPLSQAKHAIERALRRLRPSDTFQVIRFSNNADTLGPAPIVATPENVRRGLAYLRSLRSEGGTMMIEGIKAALDFPHDPSRLRFVSFLTDGYIGNEAEILGAIQQKLGPTRIFSFGVGTSVNRFLMDSMARLGRGCVAYVAAGDSSTDIMDAFMDRISHPAMTDLSIDWGGLAVDAGEVFPRRLPDLFVGRPVIITGKMRDGIPGDGTTVRVTGTVAGERRTVEVPVRLDVARAPRRGEPEAPVTAVTSKDGAALAMVWARRKIADIAENATAADAGDAMGAIRSLSLAYGLLSRYTAFVAVDSMTRTEGSFGTSVAVPVNMPEGVKYETTVPEGR